ncbi:MAG: calcium-binding protein [Pseudomonadota bacterium]
MFHMIFVDEDRIIEERRTFNLFWAAGEDRDAGINLELGALGESVAEGGIGNDIIRAGNRRKVVIYAGPGDDEIEGSPDIDLLIGGLGRDTIRGNAGNDILVIDEFDDFDGGPGEDRAIYVGTADLDINISDHDIEIFNSGAGDDFISTGLSREAALHGGPGNDRLYGSWGHDWLMGGKGNDVLEGGHGNDTYVYGRGDGRDTIHDFSFNRRTDTLYDVYSDGSKRNYRKRDVRVKEHAGQDRLLFGKGIIPSDLLIRFEGLDLLVALKDPSDYSAPFEAQSDQIRLSNWNDECDRLEYFEFQSGATVDIARLVKVNGVSRQGGRFDLASLDSIRAYGFDKTAKPADCDPREEYLSVWEVKGPTD